MKKKKIMMGLLSACLLGIGLGLSEKAAADTVLLRLYHPEMKVHFYTKHRHEYTILAGRGWRQEGVAWTTADAQGVPVYRLYNPIQRLYFFTKNASEYALLESRGWKKEGVAFRSYGTVPIYRLYHAGHKRYLYTRNKEEYDGLEGRGWKREGLAFYGIDPKAPAIKEKPKTAPKSQKSSLEITTRTEVLTTDQVVYLEDSNLEVGQSREEASVNGERLIEVRRTIEDGKVISEEEVVLKESPAQPKKVYKGTKAPAPTPPAPKQTRTQTGQATYRLTFNEVSQTGHYSPAQETWVTMTETQTIDAQTQQVLSLDSGIREDNVMDYTLSSLYELVEISDAKTSPFYHENERHIHVVVRRKTFDMQAFLAEIQTKSPEERYQLAKAAVVSPTKYQQELTQSDLNALQSSLSEATYNQELLSTINVARAAKGVAPLELHEELATGARTRATEQAVEGYFRSVDTDNDGVGDQPHTRPNGKGFSTAFNLTSLSLRSENAGQYLPDDIRELISEKWQAEKQFERFSTSPSHYDNMMNPDLTVAYFAMALSDDHKILISRKEQTDPMEENGNAVIFIQVFAVKRSVPRR